MTEKVRHLNVVQEPENRKKNALEILEHAIRQLEEKPFDQVMVILGKAGCMPEALMSGLDEIEALGQLSFVTGMIQTMQTQPLPDEDAETPPED